MIFGNHSIETSLKWTVKFCVLFVSLRSHVHLLLIEDKNTYYPSYIESSFLLRDSFMKISQSPDFHHYFKEMKKRNFCLLQLLINGTKLPLICIAKGGSVVTNENWFVADRYIEWKRSRRRNVHNTVLNPWYEIQITRTDTLHRFVPKYDILFCWFLQGSLFRWITMNCCRIRHKTYQNSIRDNWWMPTTWLSKIWHIEITNKIKS